MLEIKDPEVWRLAEEYARLTGLSLEEAVKQALRLALAEWHKQQAQGVPPSGASEGGG